MKYLEFLLATMYAEREIFADFIDDPNVAGWEPRYVEWANVEEFLKALENHRPDFNHWMGELIHSTFFSNEFGVKPRSECDETWDEVCKASIKTCEKLLRSCLKQQNCHCLVRCAVTESNRRDVQECLVEAQRDKDQHFANIYNMMLNGACTQDITFTNHEA